MNTTITDRVNALRAWMREKQLDAYIFPSTDPHCGEYVPDYWMARLWISGFNGSAGTAVVTQTDARLWTDSRYFLAAAEQLEGTPFSLMKDKVPGTPTISQWLAAELPAGSVVGMDGWVNTIADVEDMEEQLRPNGLTVNTLHDATILWRNRPSLPLSLIEIQPIEFAGETAHEKIERLREALRGQYAEATLVTQLDEIAWLTNLRGTDVHCTPVFVSYMLVTPAQATLYINKVKLTAEVVEYLAAEGIGVKDYKDISADVKMLSENSENLKPKTLNLKPTTIYLNPATVNDHLFRLLPATVNVKRGVSLIAPMRAIKNEAEIAGYRRAMLRDGVALVKFLRWLQPAVEKGGETEISIDKKLTALRAEQPLYRDLSFDTIAGYGAHGAIVHYEATPETDIPLQPRGLLLLDSGAQYQDGTTDITRTIALGPLTDEEKHDYTLVLKGHIRLAMVKFPSGSSGTQLDVLARYAMWQEAKNYLHGTGHGVGSYLSVHEGPHQFRMNYMPAPLVAGMTITNEPGIYIAGSHGCRTENTMLITHFADGEFGEFLQLEPLTLCPIDTRPIVREMMLPDEIAYLNQYHLYVRQQLLPLLDDEADRQWLVEATEALPPTPPHDGRGVDTLPE